MDNGVNRQSILERLERGEISIADAKTRLAEEADVPTRRERELALAEKFQNWNPQTMAGLTDSWQWPWPSKSWQWMWQNFSHPVYMSHSIDITGKTELKIALHQGDLFIRGWNEPMLKINGAAFDIKVGQDENIVRIASSTGRLQIWAPNSITRVEARVTPGDAWLRNIPADVAIYCQSGDLNCQRIMGNIRAKVNDGDARLIGIEGSIDTAVKLGRTYVRDISSTSVSLRSSEGDIWLSLDSVSNGYFRCESTDGDINLLTNGELACELLVEANAGGEIIPVVLPWQRLLERSEDRLHGILTRDGAFIHLASQGGKIYIQEPWTSTFPLSPR